jgi:hypothetical protein
LCDTYGATTPHDLLDAAVAYLTTEADRVMTFGGEGQEPWASDLRHGRRRF